MSATWTISGYPQVEPKTFYGIEIRGLMALFVKDIQVHDDAFDTRVKVFVNVPSVADGSWITVVQSTSTDTARLAAYIGNERTPTQYIIIEALRSLWQHELREALWIDGVPVDDPSPDHAVPP